jgi:hypothetical protein
MRLTLDSSSQQLVEHFFEKMNREEALSERNRQCLYWFHHWLGLQHRAKVTLVGLVLTGLTREVMAYLISSAETYGPASGGKDPTRERS